MAKKYQYIVDLKADTSKFKKSAGGLEGMLKPAAAAAAGLFAASMIKDAAVQVFNFGKEIDGVRTSVQKLTGLTGGALNSVTGEVKAVADVYKKDYNQVLQSGNAIAKQFGKTNSQALDLIRSGFVAGGDASGDLLNQIKEYSAQFKAAGYSASQMLAIISQSEKMGIFSDKGVDTIKEGALRIREMTTATREAMDNIGLSSREIEAGLADGTYEINDVIKMVSARLSELPATSSKVGTAIADIFGAAGEDAGLDFIRMLKDLNIELDELKKNASDQAKANNDLVEAQKALGKTASAMFGGMNESISKAKILMYNFINDSLKYGVDLVNYFIKMYNESKLFRGQIEAIGWAFKQLYTIGKTTIESLISIVGTLSEAIENIFNWKEFKKTLKDGFDEMDTILSDNWDRWKKNNKDLEDNIKMRGEVEFVTLDIAEEEAEDSGKNSADAFQKGLKSRPAMVPPLEIEDNKIFEEDLFAPGSSRGNKNRLSAMLAELNGEFSKAREFAKLYGDEITLYNDKQNILAESIKKLIDEGYSVQGEAIQGLIEKQRELSEEEGKSIENMKLMQEFSTDLAESLMTTAKQGANSFAEMGQNMLNTMRKIISGHIATGVAGAIKSAITENPIPFPFNILAAPVAAGMASSAFNSLIPQFAEGGLVHGPTMGVMGEYPGARSNPEVIAPLNKLRGILRTESTQQSGQVEFEIKGDRLVGVLNNHNRRTGRQR